LNARPVIAAKSGAGNGNPGHDGPRAGAGNAGGNEIVTGAGGHGQLPAAMLVAGARQSENVV
jgi:hypothetical protein